MKKCALVISSAFMLVQFFISCNTETSPDNNSISKDSAIIADGEASFTQKCSGCHNFRQDGIGPQLGGLTAEIPAGWIQQFIRDPKKIIESGDERASELFKKYRVVMPSFVSLKDQEMTGIIAFLNTHKLPVPRASKKNGTELLNPIPEPIAASNLVAGVELITQFPPSGDSGKLPLTRITKLGFQSKTDDLYILDLQGKLYKLQQHTIPTVYMDMAKLKPKFINEPGLATGFGSFAFHPGFGKNGLLYTTHTEMPGSAKAGFDYPDSIKVTLQWILTEWKTTNPGAVTFSGTGRELFRVNMVTGIHGVQEITFNPLSKPGDEDYGLLYIGVGDGGSVEEGYPFLAHTTDKVWGSILRIDPAGRNSANGQYGIPIHNPFVQNKNDKALGEIYAYGFRNPHRITWTKSGKMLACNIGQGNIESVNLIIPGHDYGWPAREGTFVTEFTNGNMSSVYPLPANDSIYKISYPVAQFDHDEGKAISGGFEYQGRTVPRLMGKFLFGDIASGRLFYIEIADIQEGKQATIKEWKISMNGTQKTLKDLCGNDRPDMHFGRDSQGELYILTKTDGKVYKLVNAGLQQ